VGEVHIVTCAVHF